MAPTTPPNSYPIFLTGLNRQRCVIIGGAEEAERKASGLINVGATITVIADNLTPALQGLAEAGQIEWVRRRFQAGDLDGAWLVINTLTNDPGNAEIYAEATRLGILINTMDETAHCNFVAGSTIERGPLTIAISTNGASPAFAVRLRQRLQRELSPRVGDFLGVLKELRATVSAQLPNPAARKALWFDLIDSDALADLDAGDADRANATFARIFATHGIRLPIAKPFSLPTNRPRDEESP